MTDFVFSSIINSMSSASDAVRNIDPSFPPRKNVQGFNGKSSGDVTKQHLRSTSAKQNKTTKLNQQTRETTKFGIKLNEYLKGKAAKRNKYSGTGNRTQGCSVRASDVSHYTIPDK
uniref:Uncharacterized protein n=1 Tax=Bionectria ochroleuca TaxID=29856 RepID=A0A8H7MZC7_BIOOC